MKRKFFHGAALRAGLGMATLLALAGLALPAMAAVTVTFVHSDQYHDLPFSPIDRAQVLKDMGAHFARLEKLLPPGQDLQVEVLDFDMAGRRVPNFRGRDDLRVLKGGADWPHMTLRYTLTDNGRVIASGEDQLSDMSYMDHINSYPDGDTLRYEKRMVDDWFRNKFGARRHG